MFHFAEGARPLDEQAIVAADQAIGLDNLDSTVLGYAGCALCDIGHTRRALELLEQAVEYDPSNAQAWAALGVALVRTRKARQGVEKLKHGIRISPLDTRLAYWGTILANTLFRLGKIDEALQEAKLACRRNDKFPNSRVVMAMILAKEGRREEAAAAMDEARRLSSDLQAKNITGLIGKRGARILEEAGLLH